MYSIRNRARLVTLILMSILLSSVKLTYSQSQKKLEYLVNELLSDLPKQRVNYNSEFAKYDSAAIPALINAIDRDMQMMVGFMDTEQSHIGNHRNYTGIEAAYMIEVIVARQYKNRLYTHGLIIYEADTSSRPRPMTLEDMKKIKAIYTDWWQNAKKKPRSILLKEGRDRKSAIMGSGYLWD